MVSRRTTAFTLVEILIAIVIVSIMAAVAVPNVGRQYDDFVLRQSAQDMAYLIRYGQSRAVMKGLPHRVNVDKQTGKYWLTYNLSKDAVRSPQVMEPVPGRMGRVFRVPPEIRIESDFTKIELTPDGGIEKVKFVVCAKDQCLTISTQKQRGYVHVQQGRQ